jgi:hypothetical protein
MARAGTWATVLISSGEAPATSFTEDGGTRARVLTLWGSPFGAADAATAQVVRRLDLGIREHYGHAGPRFVRHLLEHRDRWPAWRQEYGQRLAQYVHWAGDDPIAGRMAAHLAALRLTARIARAALGLPWDDTRLIAALWNELVADTPEADPAVRALKYVSGWAVAHQEEFYGRRDADRGQPHGGWAGRWDDATGWTYVGFLPERLAAVLAEGGFEPEAVVRAWRDRGWLLVDPSDKKARHRARVGAEMRPAWLVAPTRAAIDAVDGEVSP